MAKQTDTDGAADGAADLAAVKKDVEALRADLSTLLEHLGGLGEAKLREAGAAGSDTIDGLRVELERTADQLRRHGQHSVAEVERTIKERPLTALLAAFGAGLLFARLWDRR